QVDGIERDHGENARQEMENSEANIQERCDEPGEAAASNGDQRCGIRVEAADDQRGADCGPQRKTAVDRQVWEVENPERQEHAKADQAKYQPDLDCAQKRDQVHGKCELLQQSSLIIIGVLIITGAAASESCSTNCKGGARNRRHLTRSCENSEMP